LGETMNLFGGVLERGRWIRWGLSFPVSLVIPLGDSSGFM
jgi:hypothetical protein